MSDIEPSSVRLEDGEIDEGSEHSAPTCSGDDCINRSLLPLAEEVASAEIKSDNDEKQKTSVKMAILDEADSKELRKRSVATPSSSQRVYENEDIVDEDEMLCVRGASPVPFVIDRSSFTRKSPPPYDSDSFTMDMASPKRRKTSGKRRRRKRTTPKKISKEKSVSSDDQHDVKSKEGSQSPPQEKLHQLCKFYLQECCAKGRTCEYMHSEFPCKFFYMGLKCEDEAARGSCKLSHGGTLSYEMLVALIRHIHTAPNDVLGKKFVELRAKMPAGEASKMLHQMQEKLQAPAGEELEAAATSKPKTETNFVATLREKLYFLSEEQIDKLQQLRISKAEDLLYLTLAQLNAIGIHAIQIEAIQMSLIAGQDMDMRNIFPSPVVVPTKSVEIMQTTKDVDSREVVAVNKAEANVDQTWYEDEEQPLVIDESEADEMEECKTKEEEDVLIDVVSTTPPLISSDRTKSIDENGGKTTQNVDKTYTADNGIQEIPQLEANATECSSESSGASIEALLDTISDDQIELEMLGEAESPGIASPTNTTPTIDLTTSPKEDNPTSISGTVKVISQPAEYHIETIRHKETPPKDGGWKYFSSHQYQKQNDSQMQGDNSSEDWDAEEQNVTCTSSKIIDSIDSPDNSEDEQLSTALVADGICPDLPMRTPNLDNYKPALEIDAHLTYPAMEYKLYEIYLPACEVNRPPLMDKLLKANSTDPRLKKFIEKEKNYGIFPETDYSFFPPTMSQCDPRLRPGYGNTCPDQNYNASPILYGYLQRSLWYQELKSNLKIQINHSVSDLVRALNFFHKDPSPKKIFDLFQIECAGVLLEVMQNVGIFIDVNGNITEEANYQQLCAPQQSSQQYNNNNNNNSSGPPLKPGLLGYAPPGMPYSHPHMEPSNNENSFMRQAFGNQYFENQNNEFQPPGGGFYVGERNFNRNRGQSDFDPAYRRPQKRNFKRRC